jgi:hypothetical protein
VFRVAIESAFGSANAEIFLWAVPLGGIAIVATMFLPNRSLSKQTGHQKAAKATQESETVVKEAEKALVESSDARTGNDSGEAIEAELVVEGERDRQA